METLRRSCTVACSAQVLRRVTFSKQLKANRHARAPFMLHAIVSNQARCGCATHPCNNHTTLEKRRQHCHILFASLQKSLLQLERSSACPECRVAHKSPQVWVGIVAWQMLEHAGGVESWHHARIRVQPKPSPEAQLAQLACKCRGQRLQALQSCQSSSGLVVTVMAAV